MSSDEQCALLTSKAHCVARRLRRVYLARVTSAVTYFTTSESGTSSSSTKFGRYVTREWTRPAPVAPAPGRLFVGATPWGDVQIDGRAVGHTPLVALPIAAGWHHVGIVRDGFAPFERRIQLAPGEDVRLTGIVLQPLH